MSFSSKTSPKPTLTGSRLRSYAFALLTRKEYSKHELIEKLSIYALSQQEVMTLVEELAQENYQSDQRVAQVILSSHKRKGKGPNHIKMALKNKKIDQEYLDEELKQTNWLEQAYALKVRKFGEVVATEQKLKAKQARFLLSRGFEMDVVIKAISMNGYDN